MSIQFSTLIGRVVLFNFALFTDRLLTRLSSRGVLVELDNYVVWSRHAGCLQQASKSFTSYVLRKPGYYLLTYWGPPKAGKVS